jgi:CheY-like chemotaxis protein
MKILIVDDSMTSRMLFKAYLSKDGRHELFEAANFSAAQDIAQKMQPDLVVLDYSMPEYNGVEMARAMQEGGLNAKFVLLTANTQKAIVDDALSAGFVQILEKPINAEKVATLLAKLA